MLRVCCNSSGIRSMAEIEWPGWWKWEGTACCGVCVEWIVCCLSMFFKAFTKCVFSFTYTREFPFPRLHTCPWLPLNRFSACGVIKYSFPDVSIYFINAGFENRIASGVEREKLIFCQRPGNSNFKWRSWQNKQITVLSRLFHTNVFPVLFFLPSSYAYVHIMSDVTSI